MFRSLADKFQWKGTNRVYSVPFLRNRLEYTANPHRVKEYFKSVRVTRSQLTKDVLTRFHLSHNSIVVSDDEHAQHLRHIFLECQPARGRYPQMAKELVDDVFPIGTNLELRLSSRLIPAVYLSLLTNLLGADVLTYLREQIREFSFKPGGRPLYVGGLMYALSMQFPGLDLMRNVIDLLFFKSNHYTRNIAVRLEQLVFEFAAPKRGSWYEHLLEMKRTGKLSRAEFRGELTSMLVSSYALSAAISSMLLCLAARPEYLTRVRENPTMARDFVHEVLRLFPPFRQFGYEEIGVWEKPDRPKDAVTDFMVSVFGLHRNENVWADADQFRPERFAASDAMNGCKFVPFGVGKRACTGRVYSLGMLVEVLRYVCSEACDLRLGLPSDFVTDHIGLPLGANGHLVSFPVDDRVHAIRALPRAESRWGDT